MIKSVNIFMVVITYLSNYSRFNNFELEYCIVSIVCRDAGNRITIQIKSLFPYVYDQWSNILSNRSVLHISKCIAI